MFAISNLLSSRTPETGQMGQKSKNLESKNLAPGIFSAKKTNAQTKKTKQTEAPCGKENSATRQTLDLN